MENHRRLLDDPRIMAPLEEFLRTVRAVVDSPHVGKEEFEAAVVHLFPKEQVRRFKRWW